MTISFKFKITKSLQLMHYKCNFRDFDVLHYFSETFAYTSIKSSHMISIKCSSVQLSEKFSMGIDMKMLMYLVLEEQICCTAAKLLLLLFIAVVVDYCCCCCKQVQELATANAYDDTVQ